jgi:N-methylhydantoinase B/oxoprolinase/acetone carboxylase alpha subunit
MGSASVDDDILMNAGCLRLIHRIPPRSMLSPEYPAAVVAGNVETSQAVTDTLFGALEAPRPRRHHEQSQLRQRALSVLRDDRLHEARLPAPTR